MSALMNRKNSAVLVLFFVLGAAAPAQPGPGMNAVNLPRSTLTGQVFDADLAVPVEYANIVLYNQRDSQQVTGTVTGKAGRFTLTDLRPGRFYAVVSFIGYRD